ncbi:MAG: lepB [Glaciihabitans sp.]|nr:lepB [Glaciihabitans sp.]
MTSEIDQSPSGSVDTDGVSTVQKPSRSRGLKLFLRDVLLILLAALLISFLIKTFLFRSFYIPSESMEDTLLVNDRIIVNQLEPKFMPVHRGDIVVFKDPGGWLSEQPATPQPGGVTGAVDAVLGFVGLSAPDSNDHLIKRVIGLPGDHVVCCNDFGQITVNGVPLDEPYTKLPPGTTKATASDFDITVPKDSLWVMGDNRYSSADSAFHFSQHSAHVYVPYSDVVGRAVVISWPINRWTVLDDYPIVFQGTDPKTK